MKIEINVGFPMNYDFGMLKKRFMHRITKVFGFLNFGRQKYIILIYKRNNQGSFF